MTMTNEQIQALKAQMKRKHRDRSATVMRTCDYCGDHKDTVTEEDGSNICASCCDDKHAANLENIVETLLAECEADKNRIVELEAIRTAAEKLVRCKGRYHSEQNYRALAALFGVNVQTYRRWTVKPESYSHVQLAGVKGLMSHQKAAVIAEKMERTGLKTFSTRHPLHGARSPLSCRHASLITSVSYSTVMKSGW